MSNDPIAALTCEDRDWLVAHGWTEPPPEPRTVDDEMVLDCRRCGAELPIDSCDVCTFGGEPYLIATENPVVVLRRHAPRCTAAS